MERKLKAVLSLILILASAFAVGAGISTYALYNDERFDRYENMRERDGEVKYTVPTLFKNDAVFKNHKTFPLVVSNGVQYVPLEMFFGLSKIESKTDLPNGNFYFSNTENGGYITFDVASGLAMTDKLKPFRLETQIFYNTRYIPAKKTAEALGIMFEVYDSVVDGVYAVRISDKKAKLTFPEIIEMYSPVKNEPEKEEDNTLSPSVPQDDQPSSDPVTVTQTDEMGARTVYLTYDGAPNENTGKLLDVLDAYGIKATFFCTREGMLAYPDELRNILVKGHSVGIYVQGAADADSVFELFNDANDALYLVTKTKTRLLRQDKQITYSLRQKAEKNGISLWGSNISVYGGTSPADTEKYVSEKLASLEKDRRTTVAALKLTLDANADKTAKRLCEYFTSKNGITARLVDETTTPIY